MSSLLKNIVERTRSAAPLLQEWWGRRSVAGKVLYGAGAGYLTALGVAHAIREANSMVRKDYGVEHHRMGQARTRDQMRRLFRQ